jgi:hypothetical protein
MVEEEEYENGEEVIHSKVFQYVILPKEPGEYNITPALSFFDPDSNRYLALVVDSLPAIRVSAGKNYGPDQQTALDTLPLPPPAVSPDFDIWKKIPDWLYSPVLWGGVALVLFLLVIFYFLRKTKPATITAPAATPIRLSAKASRERFSHAAHLLRSGNPRAFYDELFKSLMGYLAVRFDLSPAQITQENVRRVLTERHVPSGTIQNTLAVWQTCEQALFAGQSQAAQMENTWRLAESVVQYLEKTYRR